MKLVMLDLNDKDDARIYNEVLKSLDNDHPYYKVEFLDIFYFGLQYARAFVFSDKEDNPLVVMPFYLRPVEQNIDPDSSYYDITSTWGYSGPQCGKHCSEEILSQFWAAVDDWYQKNNIISEFIRFSLNDNHPHYTGTIVPGMHNIKGKLIDPKDIWTNYNRKVRKNINRARRENLEVRIFYKNIDDDVFNAFYEIFVHTMDRTQATEMYYYAADKLRAFISANPENCAICLTYLGDKPIASEMILVSREAIYSFIGGTLSDYFGLRPNEILKHEIIKWAYEQKIDFFILGGGYGQDDGIFKYKQAFFPSDVVDFLTGRKIVNENMYNSLSGIQKTVSNISEDFFPLYRKPS